MVSSLEKVACKEIL